MGPFALTTSLLALSLSVGTLAAPSPQLDGVDSTLGLGSGDNKKGSDDSQAGKPPTGANEKLSVPENFVYPPVLDDYSDVKNISYNLVRDAVLLWSVLAQADDEWIASDMGQLVIGNWTKSLLNPCPNTTENLNWYGVKCAVTPESIGGYTAVSGIDMNDFALTGEITLEGILEKMLDLTFWHANSNSFSGKIANDLSALPYFFELDLSHNQYEGPIPDVIRTASQLVFLDLRFNKFDGEVPSFLFQEMDLDVIFINDNLLSGELPDWEGVQPRFVTLTNNQFWGTIPASISSDKSLTEILFRGNYFDTLDDEACNVANATIFDVSDNPHLKGPLGINCLYLYNQGILNITGTALYAPDIPNFNSFSPGDLDGSSSNDPPVNPEISEGTDPNTKGTDPNTKGTDPSTKGTDPNTKGTAPGGTGQQLDTVADSLATGEDDVKPSQV